MKDSTANTILMDPLAGVQFDTDPEAEIHAEQLARMQSVAKNYKTNGIRLSAIIACMGLVLTLWVPPLSAAAWAFTGIVVALFGGVLNNAFLAADEIRPEDLWQWRLAILIPRGLSVLVWTSLLFFAWDQTRLETLTLAYLFVVGSMTQNASTSSAMPELVAVEVTPKALAGIFVPLYYWITLPSSADSYVYFSLTLVAVFTTVFVFRLAMDQNAAMTEQLEQRKALLQAKRDAESANRAKDLFLSMVGHDLRTPLSIIVGGVDLVARQADEEARLKRLKTIKRASITLTSMLNDLMDLSETRNSTVSKMQFEQMDLRSTALGATHLIRHRADAKELSLRLKIKEDVAQYVVSDQTRLRRLLLNLINNTIRYSSDGEILVTIEQLPPDDRLSKKERWLFVTVENAALGLPRELQSRLFEGISHTDAAASDQQHRPGFGLAICRTIVEEMGGAIGIQSTTADGTKFWFRVPILLDQDIDPVR